MAAPSNELRGLPQNPPPPEDVGLTPVLEIIKCSALENMPMTASAAALAEFDNGDCIECDDDAADEEETFKSWSAFAGRA